MKIIVCGDCISKIIKELECKMVSNEEIIEEVEDKEYEDIEKLECCMNYEYKNNIDNVEKDIKTLVRKIDALIRNQKYILEQLNRESK